MNDSLTGCAGKNPAATSRRCQHVVEAVRIVRGLRVVELELAGAGGRFHGGAEVRPRGERQCEVRCGQHGEGGAGIVGERELERAVAQHDRVDDHVDDREIIKIWRRFC